MYKIIKNNYIIDLAENIQYIRFLPSGHIAFTDKTSAQGFLGSDNKTVYSLASFEKPGYELAFVEKISQEEFTRLQRLLALGAKITADENELTKVKNTFIEKMSLKCKQAIVSGFNLKLSDDLFYNFKLTVEDQLNLMVIENQINNGETFFIYHATSSPCKVFSKEDMQKIIQQAKKHTLFHTTYFNALKQYIQKLTDVKAVEAVKYGIDVSDTVEDDSIKMFLKQGGFSNVC